MNRQGLSIPGSHCKGSITSFCKADGAEERSRCQPQPRQLKRMRRCEDLSKGWWAKQIVHSSTSGRKGTSLFFQTILEDFPFLTDFYDHRSSWISLKWYEVERIGQKRTYVCTCMNVFHKNFHHFMPNSVYDIQWWEYHKIWGDWLAFPIWIITLYDWVQSPYYPPWNQTASLVGCFHPVVGKAKGLEFGIARTPFHDMYQQCPGNANGEVWGDEMRSSNPQKKWGERMWHDFFCLSL